jgi:DNA-binding NarL/FixJ family response regulator
MDRIVVGLRAGDPISAAGVASQLRPRPELQVVDGEAADLTPVVVVVVVVDAVDEAAVQLLRNVQYTSPARVVLVATRIDDQQLVSAAECGVAGIVRRAEATPERLVQVISAAAKGEGTVPGDLLGRLLEQVGRLQRQVLSLHGINFNGLAEREIEVLRLLADGHDTAEIALKLSYSERTIKNVLRNLIARLQVRNRTQAVAYAIRQGLI